MSVPKLRFKEFDGDWANKKIDEIAVVTSGGTPSRNISKYWNGHIPWVTTSLVDFNIINNAEEFITQDGVDNSSAKLFPKNTILMAMYGQGITRGKVAILGIDATTNQACAAIKLKDDIDTHFAFQNLMNRYEEIRDLSNEGGQKNLSAGIIKDISISYPSKPEQTKIASFLSAVDEKISQLTQKHELLSQYKQGMMQKFFSQQIRFKADDGSDFGEWEVQKLGEISKTFSGGTPQSSNKSFYEGSIPFIKSGEISQDITEQYINEIALQKSSAKLVNKGDLLYALYGATSGQVAISQIDGAINQAVLCIRSILNTQYLLNFFLLKKEEILSTYLQGGQGNLSAAILKEIYIPTPCLEEQTKIANFLSAIDQKIEVVAQQIEHAKQWKKGLLQQMFV